MCCKAPWKVSEATIAQNTWKQQLQASVTANKHHQRHHPVRYIVSTFPQQNSFHAIATRSRCPSGSCNPAKSLDLLHRYTEDSKLSLQKNSSNHLLKKTLSKNTEELMINSFFKWEAACLTKYPSAFLLCDLPLEGHISLTLINRSYRNLSTSPVCYYRSKIKGQAENTGLQCRTAGKPEASQNLPPEPCI